MGFVHSVRLINVTFLIDSGGGFVEMRRGGRNHGSPSINPCGGGMPPHHYVRPAAWPGRYPFF